MEAGVSLPQPCHSWTPSFSSESAHLTTSGPSAHPSVTASAATTDSKTGPAKSLLYQQDSKHYLTFIFKHLFYYCICKLDIEFSLWHQYISLTFPVFSNIYMYRLNWSDSSSEEIPTVLNFLMGLPIFHFWKQQKCLLPCGILVDWERNKLQMSILETGLFRHFIFSLTLVALGLSPVIQQLLRTLYTCKVVICWRTSRDPIFGSRQISDEWWHVIDLWTPSLSLGWINPSDSLSQYR